MASDEAATHERTEQPTGRRREEARRQGRIAVSRDLTAALALLGALGVQALAGTDLAANAVDALARRLSAVPRTDLTIDATLSLVGDSVVAAARIVWPLIALPAVLAIGVQLAQTRVAVSSALLRPQWSRLSPLSGLGQLLGGRGLVELARAVLKVGVVGGVAYSTVRGDWPLLVTPPGGTAALAAVAQVVGHVWLRVGVAYLLLAALDYGYQWWRTERSLRMSREELKQEAKETEGDPTLRGRIRTLQRQVATRRMVAEVKRADVVVRNPTHVAVALRYEGGKMRAPRVVAKGERLLALRIIEIARRAGVPVVENPPLARALAKAVAVGREIPTDLYRAVAEVLAYVYSLRGRAR